MPCAELRSGRVLGLLARYDIGLLFAVAPGTAGQAPAVVRACRDAAVRVGVWPLLGDEDGRFASERNGGPFARFVGELLGALEAAGALPGEVALDLEPSIELVRRLLALDPRAALALWRGPASRGGTEQLVAAAREIRARGLGTLAAAVPLVLADGPDRRGWQGLLGTPLDALPVERVSVMLYSSLLEGYSRGLLRRPDALALVAVAARTARRRWGPRASLSLGAVGPGALGDERTYRDVAELADDIAIARRAGVDDLCLFDLGGVLGRPPAERWLDALAHTEPARGPPPLTARAAAVVTVVAAAAHPLGWRRLA